MPQLEPALFVPAIEAKGGLLASTIEIAPRTDADLPLLFGLAKAAFVDLPGWSDERVLQVLRRDVTLRPDVEDVAVLCDLRLQRQIRIGRGR